MHSSHIEKEFGARRPGINENAAKPGQRTQRGEQRKRELKIRTNKFAGDNRFTLSKNGKYFLSLPASTAILFFLCRTFYKSILGKQLLWRSLISVVCFIRVLIRRTFAFGSNVCLRVCFVVLVAGYFCGFFPPPFCSFLSWMALPHVWHHWHIHIRWMSLAKPNRF